MGIIEQMIVDGHVGYYTSVRATSFFCHNRKTKTNINLLTIWKLDDSEEQDEIKALEKYGELTEDFIWGKTTYQFDKSDLISNLDSITKNQSIHINGSILNFDQLKQQGEYPQFIPCTSENRIRLIFEGCFDNHVFEYYNSDKTSLESIVKDESIIKKIGIKAAESNIKLDKCTDVLGNLYIQIPCNLLVKQSRLNDYSLKLHWNEKVKTKPRVNVIYIINKQHTETQYFSAPLDEDDVIHFRSKSENIKILVQRNDTLFNFFSSNNCPHPDFAISVADHTGSFRSFTNDFIPPIEILSFRGTSIGRINHVNEAIYTAQSAYLINELVREKKFSQYPASMTPNTQNQGAEELLKDLIQKYGQRGFIIWDPYLQSTQVLNYVIQSYQYDSNVKILTSKKVYEKKKDLTREQYFDQYKNDIISFSNCIGLNLEVRCSWGQSGLQFHDRFIIFPESGLYKECLAWSLGISLNQIGEEHHIIQKVDNARSVLYSFNLIWDSLDSSHVIYKS